MTKDKSSLKIDRRLTIQMVFLTLALIATMANVAYIHYVCPICGVITVQQLFTADIPLYLKLHNPATMVVGAMALLAVLAGPVFCGWVCPFGGYQDLISKMASKIMPSRKKIRVPDKIDKVLRYLRYGVLVGVIYLTAQGSVALLESNNPYHALLGLVKGEWAVTGLVLLATVTLGAWFIDRPWCRYLCPYGAVLGLSNSFKLFKVNRNESSCVGCKKCSKACPMGLNVAESKSVTQLQCISCMDCVKKEVCPVDKTIGISILPPDEASVETVKSHFRVGIASGLLIAMAGTGFAASKMKNDDSAELQQLDTAKPTPIVKSERSILNRNVTPSQSQAVSDGRYKDGVYIGESVGYQPGLKVQVTVKNKKITDVSIVQHNETPGFYERAFRLVPTEIVQAQGTGVDTVSGATYSSKGIIGAVNKALKNAVDTSVVSSGVLSTSVVPESAASPAKNVTVSKPGLPANKNTPKQKVYSHKKLENKNLSNKDVAWEDEDSEDRDSDDNHAVLNTNSNPPQTLATASKGAVQAQAQTQAAGQYKNGTYYGTGVGYQPGLKVKVVVSGNRITSIGIVSDQETPRFFSRAKNTIIGRIIAGQKSEVDTVSGATYSSVGIMEAVKMALSSAKL